MYYFCKSNTYVPLGFSFSAVCQLCDALVKRQISFQNVVGGVSDVITLLTSELVKAGMLPSALGTTLPERVRKTCEERNEKIRWLEDIKFEINNDYFFPL